MKKLKLFWHKVALIILMCVYLKKFYKPTTCTKDTGRNNIECEKKITAGTSKLVNKKLLSLEPNKKFYKIQSRQNIFNII